MRTSFFTFLFVSTWLLSTHAAADTTETRMVRRTTHQHLAARDSIKKIAVGHGFEIMLPEADMHSDDEDEEKENDNTKRANGPWRPQIRGHAAHADHTPKFMKACAQYRNSFNKVASETGLPATLLMSLSFFNTGCQDHPFSQQRIAREGLQFGIMQFPADVALVLCDQSDGAGSCPPGSEAKNMPQLWTSPQTLNYLRPFRSPEANIREMADHIRFFRDDFFRAKNVSKPTLAALRLLYGVNGYRWLTNGRSLGPEYGLYVTKPGIDVTGVLLDIYQGGLYDDAGHRRGHWHV